MNDSTAEGLLLADKPSGPTSHDIVAVVRRVTGQRRIGHTGTLDPLAEGLLLLVLGRCTRLARFLPGAPKHYEGTFVLGLTTATDDITGEPLSRSEGTPPTPDQVLEAARLLSGSQLQSPPRVSARKVGGRRLYRLARAGVEVDVAPRQVMVHRFDLEPTERDAWVYRFRAEVSTGTYIRALVRDLGQRLGCGGALASLRRTRIASFAVEAGLRIDPSSPPDSRQITAALVRPSRMTLAPPALLLETPDAVRRFLHGVGLTVSPALAGLQTVRSTDGELLGIGQAERGALRPTVVLGQTAADR